MSTHNFYFIVAVALFFVLNLAAAGYFYWRARRLSQASWDELIARLVSTDRDGISLVAHELVDDWGQVKMDIDEDSALEANELWELVGGLKGLQILEKNSEVLIEIAFHVQRWYPEAVVIAEQLRRDARELQWHVSRLKGAAKTGNLQVSFPFYARRAVTTYYLMTCRVLQLYEAGQFSTLAELRQAL